MRAVAACAGIRSENYAISNVTPGRFNVVMVLAFVPDARAAEHPRTTAHTIRYGGSENSLVDLPLCVIRTR